MLSLRKHKISRLEEFSDAVFGIALTLLVITSSVSTPIDGARNAAAPLNRAQAT